MLLENIELFKIIFTLFVSGIIFFGILGWDFEIKGKRDFEKGEINAKKNNC